MRLAVHSEPRSDSRAVHELRLRDPDAIVAFLPCDHHYSDDRAFLATVIRNRSRLPDQPEIEDGWIEPGTTIPDSLSRPVWRVNRFWEKPTLQNADELLRGGSALLHRVNLKAPIAKVPSLDFLRDVFACHSERLLVIRDASGWAGLGSPFRVVNALVKNGVRPP